MKLRTCLLALVLAAAAIRPAYAQGTPAAQSTPVVQTGQSAQAATACYSLDAASGSATAPAQSGKSFYITWVDINIGATGTISAVAPVKASSSGIIGTAPTFGLFHASALTIGQISNPVFGNLLLKGQVATAVSITGGATTNLVWHITLCGYYDLP
jgi:hypothetical protein